MADVALHIPKPLQIVIDDVGWWSGRNGSASNEPYRTGIARNHVPADYAAIARLGRGLGMRPQAAMILGEWDVDDSLRALPSAQWMGESWHNPWPRGPMDEAADILRREKAHLELTLHGIGHEYWPADRTMRRAEWFDLPTRSLRPREHVHGVLDAFARLLDIHNLGPMPRSFVPCAFAYGFDSQLTEDLREAGVVYNSTVFRSMTGAQAAQDPCFGVERGIITLDRGYSSPPWEAIGVDPAALEGYNAEHFILGLHWPNILHPDPSRNGEVVDGWIRFLKPLADRVDRMLARDTADGWSQLVYHRKAHVARTSDREWTIGFDAVDQLQAAALGDELTVNVAAPRDAAVTVRGGGVIELIYREAGGFHALRLRRSAGDVVVCCAPRGGGSHAHGQGRDAPGAATGG